MELIWNFLLFFSGLVIGISTGMIISSGENPTKQLKVGDCVTNSSKIIYQIKKIGEFGGLIVEDEYHSIKILTSRHGGLTKTDCFNIFDNKDE